MESVAEKVTKFKKQEDKISCPICKEEFKKHPTKWDEAHGTYICGCGSKYCSSINYLSASCLNCGERVERTWLQKFNEKDMTY